MSLEHLWAGWRSAYVTEVAAVPTTGGDGCVLCRLSDPGLDDADVGVVWRGRRCAAVLNAYPYTSGHLMVMPTRHVADPDGLGDDEWAELWVGVRQAVAALTAAYRPGGINVGMNLGRPAGAGVPGHLHVHALPRWDGDTNFMTATAGVRVLPEPLPDSWAKLRAAWPEG